jgi:hypothetical protein
LKERIDQRRMDRGRHLLIGIAVLTCKLHSTSARPVPRAVLPVADEAFLSEHRYRNLATA